jgi:hypothetical protein
VIIILCYGFEGTELPDALHEELQENAERAGPAAGASYTLIGAIILLGGVGYAIDAWRGTSSHWFLLGGLPLGVVVGMWSCRGPFFANESGVVDDHRERWCLARGDRAVRQPHRR